MKCPKCGFVSFPGLAQCKKCGHQFVAPPPKEAPAVIADLSVRLPPRGGPVPAVSPPQAGGDVLQPPSSDGTLEGGQSLPLPSATEVTIQAAGLPLQTALGPADKSLPRAVDGELPSQTTLAPEIAQPWRAELAERVQNFRHRRARLRQGFDPSGSLDLEFEDSGTDQGELDLSNTAIDSPQGEGELDFVVGMPSSPDGEMPVLDALPLENKGSEFQVSSSAAGKAGELALDDRAVKRDPVEIVLESSLPSSQAAERAPATLVLPTAPLAKRFFAGVVDALVLLLGAGLFALIFRRVGGRISLQPANLWVLAIVAVLFILLYFGLFTALASSTPGLLWMGLEVRNLDGTSPTGAESFLRAFGYLVSVIALMQGFVWALVDSEGLTWHDRMSGTFIAASDRGAGFGI